MTVMRRFAPPGVGCPPDCRHACG